MAQQSPTADFTEAIHDAIHDLVEQGQPPQVVAAFIMQRWPYPIDEILFSIIYWGGVFHDGQYVLDLLHFLDFTSMIGAEVDLALDQACYELSNDTDPELATRLCDTLRLWLSSARAREQARIAAIERAAAEARGMVGMQSDIQTTNELAQARWRAFAGVNSQGIDAPPAAEPGLRRMPPRVGRRSG